MDKVKPLHIVLAYFFGTLLVAGILYYAMIRPQNDLIAASVQATNDAVKANGTDEAIARNTALEKKTKQDNAAALASWLVNSRVYMPQLGFADAGATNSSNLELYESKMYQGRYGLKDLPKLWSTWIQAWYDAQAPNGIHAVTDFPIDSFPADPNYVAGLSYIRFPLGDPWHVQVTARDFNSAMAHLNRFSGLHAGGSMRSHGVPVIDNVQLSGQSPQLMVSYDLSLYIIPQGAPPAADPFIGVAAGGSGSGGGRPGSGGGGGAPTFFIPPTKLGGGGMPGCGGMPTGGKR